MLLIKIVREQHFIEGDKYHAFLIQESNGATMLVAYNVEPEKYLDMCENLQGLKFRLEQLGNNVRVLNQFNPDPNFETAEDAQEYINKGE